MGKRLSRRNIDAIVHMIDNWSGEKLTWRDICEGCHEIVGVVPTRQSLSSHKRIKEAYGNKKRLLFDSPGERPLPSSLRYASNRIDLLETKVNRLEEENRQLLQQFAVWQYNAYKHGLTEWQLNEELPKIDRDRTEDAL
ncbi:MAG TPA: hypothetical protein PKH39_10185 [Woeseiaceae bacterium]|nr:hypothetical protein [Woeseiaceae bacterium]